MATLQEIELQLNAINESKFQQLCDEFLFETEPYSDCFNRSGSQKGKAKTKRGTPDSFWILPNGQYVFAEYTTINKKGNAAAFLKKLGDDIDKCFDSVKTGIAVEKIDKLILCFNAEILPREIESLKTKALQYGVTPKFISIDTLAMNLQSRYQHLAAKYLNLQLDTGQVLRPEDFIKEYATGRTTIPLDNKFLFRERELAEVTDALGDKDIAILAGAAGVGKSKLALEVIRKWEQAYASYTAYCVSDKHQNIFQDVVSKIKPDKNYIIFIDDANRQGHHLQMLLPFLKSTRSGKIKIVISVRDYALGFVTEKCWDYTYTVCRIQSLPDEELKQILEGEDFNIRNREYLKRILGIAQGNARVAIMAARLALEHENLNVLHDIFDLYDEYFTSFIKDQHRLNDKQLQKVLGLLSFFFAIDKTAKTDVEAICQRFDISRQNLLEAFTELERLELAESSNDNTVIKISDQVLATYFFYKSFVKDKVLNFETLLNDYFETHSHRFDDSLLPAQRDFGYHKVIDPIQNSCIRYFEKLSQDKDKAYDFLRSLWFCLPDHTLAFVEAEIEGMPDCNTPLFVADKKNRNQTKPDDNNLRLLSNFYHQTSDLLLKSLELSFRYVEKKPENYDALYRWLFTNFGYRHADAMTNFYRQRQLVKILVSNGKKNNIYLNMFFDLFPDLMKSVNMVTESGWKRETLSFYKYRLPLSKEIKGLRRKIWKHASRFFTHDLQRAEEAVFKYIEPSIESEQKILVYDVAYLLQVIDKYFTEDKFVHCYYVQKLVNHYEKLGIVHASFDQLKAKFYSLKYRFYELIDTERVRKRKEYEYNVEVVDINRFQKLKEKEVRYKLKFNDVKEFRLFYDCYCEIATSEQIHPWNFPMVLDVIIDETYRYDKELAFDLLRIVQEQNKTRYTPHRIISTVCEDADGDLNMLFSLFVDGEYPARTEWIINFGCYITERQVKKKYYAELMKACTDETGYVYYDFKKLEKFKRFNKNIYQDVLRLFIDKRLQGINVCLQYDFFKDYGTHFTKDSDLLKQAYFVCEQQQNFDHSGKDILEILRIDPGFLLDYVKYHSKGKVVFSSRDFDHLSIVWRLAAAERMIARVFDYLANMKYYHVKEDFANAFFKHIDEQTKERAKTFLMAYMKTNKNNATKVNMVFDITRNSLKQYYNEIIIAFLKVNNKPDEFKQLRLQSSYFFGSADTIVGAMKATELEGIINAIEMNWKGRKPLQQIAYLKGLVVAENVRAEHERKRKFVQEDW